MIVTYAVMAAMGVLIALSIAYVWLLDKSGPAARRDADTKRRLARNSRELRVVTPNLRVVRGGKP